MPRLSTRTLGDLPAGTATPAYDRSSLVTGIVHVGVGAFHRAHQAMYVDRLLQAGAAQEWAICGVGLLPGDARTRDALREQDGLYTLTLKHTDGSVERRVIGAISEYLYAPDDPEAVVAKLAAPTTRILSLTITEGGYNLDPATGEFDLADAAVTADLARTGGWTTVFGLVVEALARRRERGVPPFTVMCCDNIENNGEVAKESFCAFADARDPDLGAWVRETVRFPSSMVDRITPATAAADLAEVADATGLTDEATVVAEPFTQWVLEDDFTLGRPAFEDVGVQVVHDVRPYELMKLRLLNASHQALCYFAYLSGYRYVHDAALDPAIAQLLAQYMEREGTPTLEPVPGVDLAEYRTTLIQRFSNPALGDTVARLCAYSSDRIPKWLLPVVRENLAAGGEVERSAAVVASWARYAEGVDEDGRPIDIVDQLADTLNALAQNNDTDDFITNRALFGDLAEDDRFRTAYRWTLNSLHTRGARATLTDLVRPDLHALIHGS